MGWGGMITDDSLYDSAAVTSCQMRTLAGAFDQMRHGQNGRKRHIAPGNPEGLDQFLIRGEPQVLIRQNSNGMATAVIGRKKLDPIERSFGRKCGQSRDQANAKSCTHQFERDFVGAAMRNDPMRREHALIPLLNSQCVLRPEIELDATVEYATNIRRSGV